MGRDSTYTPELAAEICVRIADGESLRAICNDLHMPGKATVLRWLHDDEEFRDQYARARESQAEGFADDLIEISDNGSNDWMERNDPENAGWICNGEHQAR